MILIGIGLGIAACFVCSGTALFVPAIVATVASIWGYGVMANFRDDPGSAPNYAALLSMIGTLASVVLLVAGFII